MLRTDKRIEDVDFDFQTFGVLISLVKIRVITVSVYGRSEGCKPSGKSSCVHSFFNLLTDSCRYSELRSMPIYFRPSRLQATPVVEEPQKGSKTTSPSRVDAEIIRSNK